MERRNSRRIVVVLKAEIISDKESFSGFLEIPTEFDGVNFYAFAGTIENMSEEGLMISIPDNSNLNLNIGSRVEIGFQVPPDERLKLNCEVRWSRTKTSRHDRAHDIGLRIIDPSPEYNTFLNKSSNQIK